VIEAMADHLKIKPNNILYRYKVLAWGLKKFGWFHDHKKRIPGF